MKLIGNNKLRFGLLSLVMAASSLCCVNAQTKSNGGQLTYPQKVMPTGIDFFHFSTYYFSDSHVYNLLGTKIGNAISDIASLKVNPSGISYATLAKYDGGSLVAAGDLWQTNQTLHEFYDVENASAIAYTPDGRQLLIAMPNKLAIYDATYYNYIEQMAMPFEASLLKMSHNGHTLAATKSYNLGVWDFDNKIVFKEIEMSATVNDIDFSADDSKMAVLTSDGKMYVYDASNMKLLQTYEQLGNAAQCSFHPDGALISVVTNSQRIALLSLDDPQYRSYIDNEEGGTSSAKFVKDGKKQTYLVYNTASSIVYKPMD